jgi:hypothetical protein
MHGCHCCGNILRVVQKFIEGCKFLFLHQQLFSTFCTSEGSKATGLGTASRYLKGFQTKSRQSLVNLPGIHLKHRHCCKDSRTAECGITSSSLEMRSCKLPPSRCSKYILGAWSGRHPRRKPSPSIHTSWMTFGCPFNNLKESTSCKDSTCQNSSKSSW